MKNLITTLIGFALFSHLLFGQNEKKLPESILNSPENWRTEIIPFPLPFAPKINFKGFEDIRFAEGWAQKESESFWTYTFIWYLDKNPQLSEDKLDQTMNMYFDGLMPLVASEKGIKPEDIIKTQASFIKNSKKDYYIGKITLFDGFFELKPFKLHVTAEQSYCNSTQKYMVRFNLSPKAFEDEIWNSFKEVVIKLNCE